MKGRISCFMKITNWFYKFIGSKYCFNKKIQLKNNYAFFNSTFLAHGKVVDATQEMLAVGLCNVVGSFVSSIPVNASFSRAAVGNASGAKTPFASVYTSIFIYFILIPIIIIYQIFFQVS